MRTAVDATAAAATAEYFYMFSIEPAIKQLRVPCYFSVVVVVVDFSTSLTAKRSTKKVTLYSQETSTHAISIHCASPF